jgi:hypothetical protein
MTARQLEEGCYWARREFNTVANIARRACDLRGNMRSPYALSVFLAANAISRTEIRRKQGVALGPRDEPVVPWRPAPSLLLDDLGRRISNYTEASAPVHGVP